MNVHTLNISFSNDSLYADLLRDCYAHATNSNHPSTHTAALLVQNGKVVLRGTNILPPAVQALKERFEGENKHIYLNHSERDVLYKAARNGIPTQSLMMVMPWLPCLNCANGIISAGITTLVVHKQMIERTRERWQEELKNAVKILNEAEISIIAYDGIVGVKAYMNKQEWDA